MKTNAVLLAAVCAASPLALAQRPARAAPSFGAASHIVVPQWSAPAVASGWGTDALVIEDGHARVELVDQTARTELVVTVRNPAPRPAEAVLLLPVPEHAAVSAFAFDGPGGAPTARLLSREEARATYDAIVSKLRDPGLLEFAGEDLVRSSLFPVPACGSQRLRLCYEQLLEQDQGRLDYVLPRSAALANAVSWQIEAVIRSSSPVTAVFSPSHELVTERLAPGSVRVRLGEAARREPGTFRLSWLRQQGDGVSASLFACPGDGGGHFLLLAGLPPLPAAARDRVRREVTLVLDRSGSMSGGKLEQAAAAALQVIEGLAPEERFQIIDYSDSVARFAAAPVVRDADTLRDARSYLEGLRPGGSTDIHGALCAALAQPAQRGFLPLVLFLTDGLPTAGITDERMIRDVMTVQNPHARRVFTFGVGHDVNAPLLDRIAEASRAKSTYVAPGADVEVAVAHAFAELRGPVLCDVRLETLDENGEVDTRAVRDLLPAALPDLYEGDQLVLLGRYLGERPLSFRLSGSWLGRPRSFAFRFALDRASPQNAFVARLWASRRIGELVDQVRQAGAGARPGGDPFADPRLAELREEILLLSTRYGILSEYTAFLATAGTRLDDWAGLGRSCGTVLDHRAMQVRSGGGAMNQAQNLAAQKAQVAVNMRNGFLDAGQQRVEIGNVQQLCDRGFFQRGARWIDGRLARGGNLEPDRVVRRGSVEFAELLEALQAEGKGALLSLSGEILLDHRGERVLVVPEAAMAAVSNG